MNRERNAADSRWMEPAGGAQEAARSSDHHLPRVPREPSPCNYNGKGTVEPPVVHPAQSESSRQAPRHLPGKLWLDCQAGGSHRGKLLVPGICNNEV